MLAFLKRRWILLSCAVACAILSCITWSFFSGDVIPELPPAPHIVPLEFGVLNGKIVLLRGSLAFFSDNDVLGADNPSVHVPNFGRLSDFDFHYARYLKVSVPLWLPLSAIFGWIVIRELRWREKRARKAEAP